jgi:DNA-binding XRE family transcriptional regulator
MVRHPTADNARNPLRQLRELIDGTGAANAATQAELSRIIGVPLDTIKAIESGRRSKLRPLSDQIRKRVLVLLGVSWHEEKERWVSRCFDGRTVTTSVATAEYVKAYRQMLDQSRALDRDRDAVKMRIDALFDQIPERYWMRLLKSMQGFVDELRDEFATKFRDRKKLDWVFAMSSDNFFPIIDPKTGKASGNRSYSRDLDGAEVLRYRKRMAEHYNDLTKHVQPDGSWVVTFGEPEEAIRKATKRPSADRSSRKPGRQVLR